MNIGQSIKLIRKQKGLTQTQLANLIGSSRTTINQIELNNTKPKQETINKICNIFQVEEPLLYILAIPPSNNPTKHLSIKIIKNIAEEAFIKL